MDINMYNTFAVAFGFILLLTKSEGMSYGGSRTIEEQPRKECPYLNCPYQRVAPRCLVPTAYWYEGRLCPGCYRNVCSTYAYYPNQYNNQNQYQSNNQYNSQNQYQYQNQYPTQNPEPYYPTKYPTQIPRRRRYYQD